MTGHPAYRITRAGLCHVPEGRGIFANLTVEENLVLSFRQRAGRRAVSDSLAHAYEAFPVLGQRRKQRGGTLSGGQQRLLSLAKVLVVPPRLLMADELSLGLAPVVVDAVYEGLREINRAGTALLVVEQQVDRALELAETGRYPRARRGGLRGAFRPGAGRGGEGALRPGRAHDVRGRPQAGRGRPARGRMEEAPALAPQRGRGRDTGGTAPPGNGEDPR